MNVILSLILSGGAVFGLVVFAFLGVWGAHLEWLFGVVIPYLAVVIFFVGIVYRVVKWAKSPVPFRIPSTCAQQKTLPWIKYSYADRIDNPATTGGVVVRMILEVFCFRSLLRNTRLEFGSGDEITYKSAKWLWLAAIVFHYTFLVVLLRHLRFFTEPMPFFVTLIERVDGFFQVTLPVLYQSGFLLGAALTFLLLRRLIDNKLRYISLPADYFPLLLILAIAKTGILMRYVFKADVVSIKELTLGLVSFSPTVPEGISVLFYIHVFLVSVLFAYFPFSKLVHMAGVFLSPTRNLSNNNRVVRHINPWNYPVKLHTYQDYENEFREKMIGAGLPVEKQTASTEEKE
ncbi:MAG: sulfate reduction electron transfer complex DsrMKJOP subunit DsrM [Thermodesulfobacteriota bacterium]|nr:sulfate reduction electron transfer complex DsrMKJOP subunit DsrM [Thermodesulfobacteriota bacterium]